MMPPRATYRLQLNKDFTFADATALVPYLDELGISHAYLSPILKARPGSTHGYDTVDHTQIDPELGSIDELRTLAGALQERGMGILLDFVPNHMGVGGADNVLWLDVLKLGRASRYADWFDIDWDPPHPGMEGKLLLPFLGASYAESLAAGHLRLKADDEGFAVWAYDGDKLPVRPEDAALLLQRFGSREAAVAALTGEAAKAESWVALDGLIATQHWRLAHFAVASDEINYRRFFINSDLAGIRIDRREVFDHAHALIFDLIDEGLVQGLRLDHIDGLLDPKAYLQRLRQQSPRPIYLVVEKILAPHEQLRADWPVDGTTGYEVGAQLTRLLTAEDGQADVTNTYDAFVGRTVPPAEEAYRCKLRVMDNELAAELATLSRLAAAVAWSGAATRDLTELGLRRGLREVIAHLAVYRTYADDRGLSDRDRRELCRAVGRARRSQPQIQPMVWNFIEALLGGQLGPHYDPKAIALVIGRFQQLAGPVMAKGLEDTALYRYNRLVALNEVGAHPDRFSVSPAAFHDSNRRRLQTHPHSMIATSTHDTKRGEDTRVMIGAITGDPGAWTAAVHDWREMLASSGAAIHPNDQYLFFQLMLGGWPMNGSSDDFADRIKGAMIKSLREARERNDWGVNDTAYEAALTSFVDRALVHQSFMSSFRAIRAGFVAIARRKGLIQAGLKLTIPGVPDIYRGAEDWEQSFVDPDNRRPVDFAGLYRRLQAPQPDRDDKLVLTQTLLRFRKAAPNLFASGTYEPIPAGADVLAFRRSFGGDELVVLADLSSRHEAGLPQLSTLPTLYGSHEAPLWILGQERG
ncbi:malto-oligosyltrehalose synthase [Devosia sediminis]|uniref:malto-oligosyltrehalose synthase n=1 Tax=Devosia sediminis TaxID=2798801 RepID=UPI001F2B98D6|nr:malto-oligosyltrehalose synthase [Devosia sediminis]